MGQVHASEAAPPPPAASETVGAAAAPDRNPGTMEDLHKKVRDTLQQKVTYLQGFIFWPARKFPPPLLLNSSLILWIFFAVI